VPLSQALSAGVLKVACLSVHKIWFRLAVVSREGELACPLVSGPAGRLRAGLQLMGPGRENQKIWPPWENKGLSRTVWPPWENKRLIAPRTTCPLVTHVSQASPDDALLGGNGEWRRGWRQPGCIAATQYAYSWTAWPCALPKVTAARSTSA